MYTRALPISPSPLRDARTGTGVYKYTYTRPEVDAFGNRQAIPFHPPSSSHRTPVHLFSAHYSSRARLAFKTRTQSALLSSSRGGASALLLVGSAPPMHSAGACEIAQQRWQPRCTLHTCDLCALVCAPGALAYVQTARDQRRRERERETSRCCSSADPLRACARNIRMPVHGPVVLLSLYCAAGTCAHTHIHTDLSTDTLGEAEKKRDSSRASERARARACVRAERPSREALDYAVGNSLSRR